MPPKRSTAPPAPAPAPPTANGILIRPRTAVQIGKPAYDGVCAELVVVKAPLSVFNSLPWEPSPISAALGLPVKVARWPSEKGQPNEGALGLFMHADPEQEDFGRVKYQFVDGAVLVAKTGGDGELRTREVQALLCYLSDLSHEVASFLRTSHDDRIGKAKELAGRRITKEAFGRFLKRF
ncbi:hypothetical protein LTR08_007535 [Meristemomyces frigidus]|nr:hypothetical protein LTR08_007535 [Meristemomyces frigidus]